MSDNKKYTKYSKPWRKKVAEIYDIPEDQMQQAKKEQVVDFERGVIAGMAKTKADLTKNPDVVIDILKCMSDENRNKVLDEFCEPIKKETRTCENCEYRNVDDSGDEDSEPCCDCTDFDKWESITGHEKEEENPEA